MRLFQTGLKKGRGRAEKSVALIEAMYDIAEAAEPITGRGVGYKLFTAGLIPGMDRNSMQGVYRLLKEAREEGIIPWEWIVDETRELEIRSSWSDPEAYASAVIKSYRRDYWQQQPVRVEVWSEKGTVRGILAPVLDKYGVGFRVMHGFTSATCVNDISEDDDGRELLALYVGDYDPSGMYMSEVDLPKRLEKYEGYHVTVERLAIKSADLDSLLTFPASDKKKDMRHAWFVREYGDHCCELDALDPNDLRQMVEDAIDGEIDQDSWVRCVTVEKAEKESLVGVMREWRKRKEA
jgi:hypothetical protein